MQVAVKGSQASREKGINGQAGIVAGQLTVRLLPSTRARRYSYCMTYWIGPRQEAEEAPVATLPQPGLQYLRVSMLMMLLMLLMLLMILMLKYRTSRKPCFTARATSTLSGEGGTFNERIQCIVAEILSQGRLPLRLQSMTPPTPQHHHVEYRPQTL